MKKIAAAGFFLFLLILGIAYISTHHSESNGVDAEVPTPSARPGDGLSLSSPLALQGERWHASHGIQGE
jgi:hypothetical protein